ncbi:MAG: type I restriction endonuclease subunit R [Salinarimonas sp.]
MTDDGPRSPAFALTEAGGVQLQALATLSNLGWRYIPRAAVERMRGGRGTSFVLEEIALKALARINGFEQDGVRHAFTASAVAEGLSRLRERPFEGLLKTNEGATDDLLGGVALRQTVDGLARERQFRFVDWENPAANDLAMTSEFRALGRSGEVRLDVALFVNGIPFAAIELKRDGGDLDPATRQMFSYQSLDHGAPGLFSTMQILVAGGPDAVRYATVGTKPRYWSAWREPRHGGLSEEEVAAAVNGMGDYDELERIYADFRPHRETHEGLREGGARFLTDLDRTLVGLFTPARALDLARRFTLFDKGVKKIARHQQVSAVHRVLARTRGFDETGARRGGVIWHTQGSGKSLTMVMLARALVWENPRARIVIVTDRRDLDRQIANTFRAARIDVATEQARTGEHLAELLRARTPLVTTIVNKFRALTRKRFEDRDENVYILVDESHRSQYGDDESFHADMRRAFPRAAYLGFTGTPLTKRERNTFVKFGDLIDSYTIDDAVRDGAVLRLYYEGRAPREEFNEAAVDAWFERTAADLTETQRARLKKRMTAPGILQEVPGRLKAIAFDIRAHFLAGFKPDGFKGQVVAPSKLAAVRLKALFDAFNEDFDDEGVTAEVVISPPDKREAGADEAGAAAEVVRFWERTVGGRSAEEYEADVIARFDGPGAPDLLIVVSKLLTGFDVQRNAVLYLCRDIREHNLLQAIARVNRVYEADEPSAPVKTHGLVIDYAGVLEDLSDALTASAALANFDEQDLEGALISLRREANTLPELHRELLSLFDDVANAYDPEAYALALVDEQRRDAFRRALSAFAGALGVALGLRDWLERTPRETVDRYKRDLARFEALRRDVSRRYGEALDFKPYQARIRRLLEEEIRAHEVGVVTPEHDLLARARGEEEEDGRSAASLADEIHTRMDRSITERMDADPTFYKSFAEMVREAFERFHRHRGDERAYLDAMRGLADEEEARRRGEGPGVPERLRGDPDAIAIHGVIADRLGPRGLAPERLADLTAAVITIVRARIRVGWQDSGPACNEMLQDLEDALFEQIGPNTATAVPFAEVEAVSAEVVAVARVRMKK